MSPMAIHTRSMPSRLSIVEATELHTQTAGEVQFITAAASASNSTGTTHTTPPTSFLPARPANVYHPTPAHTSPDFVPDTVQHPTLNTRSPRSGSLPPTSQSPNIDPRSPPSNIQHSSSTHPYNTSTGLSGQLSQPCYSTVLARRKKLFSDARRLKFVFSALMFVMAVAGLWMQIVSLRPKVSPN